MSIIPITIFLVIVLLMPSVSFGINSGFVQTRDAFAQSSSSTQWGPVIDYKGRFTLPTGIASDSQGNIYVVDSSANNIQKFAPDGSFLQLWGSPGSEDRQFSYPTGVAIGPSTNNVYVVERGGNRIQEFTSAGEFIASWGNNGPDDLVTNDGKFSNPTGIAIDSQGSVYVVDSGNNRIQKFSASGEFIAKWGEKGTADGQFDNPAAVAVDSSGVVFVSDFGNGRIERFTSSGDFLGKWNLTELASQPSGGNSTQPALSLYSFGLAADKLHNLYLTTSNSTVLKVGPDGKLQKSWGGFGLDDGKFAFPLGVTVNPENDRIYVVDSGNSRIQMFSQDGQFLGKWGSRVSVTEQIFPSGIAIDSMDNVYIADGSNWQVDKLDRNGNLLLRWNVSDFVTSEGFAARPTSIAIDTVKNVIYVADDQYHVQVFTALGKEIGQWNITRANPDDDSRASHLIQIGADSSGNVFVIELGVSDVREYSSTGKELGKWSLLVPGDQSVTFNPTGIAVDQSGNVYVADYSRGTIQKFSNDGKLLLQWGSRISKDGDLLDSPYALAVNPFSGNVYVADNDNHRIQEFSADGKFILRWGTEGTGVGQFIDPTLIAVDSLGDTYVVDSGSNYRLQKFTHDSIFVTKIGDQPPVAHAGKDIVVTENNPVTLDGSASFDPDKSVGDLGVAERITYSWKQTAGPVVVLPRDDTTEPEISFNAPVVGQNQTMTFELQVSDYLGQTSADSVNVVIRPIGRESGLLSGPSGTLSDSSGGEPTPPLMALSGNHVYTAWSEFYPDSNSSKVLFATSSDNGTTFGNVQSIRDRRTQIVEISQMTAQKEHVFLLWAEYDQKTGYSDIMFSASHNYGANFSSPILIADKVQGTESITMTSASGTKNAVNVYIVWTGEYGASNGIVNVWSRASNDNGTSFREPVNVSKQIPGGYRAPLMAALNDSLYLVWNEDSSYPLGNASLSQSIDGGSTFGPVTTVASGGAVEAMTLSEDSDRLYFVIYRSDQVPNNQGGYSAMNNMYFLVWSPSSNRAIGEMLPLTNNSAGQEIRYDDPSVFASSGKIYIKWVKGDNKVYTDRLELITIQPPEMSFETALVATWQDIPLVLGGDSGTVLIGDSARTQSLAISGNTIHIVFQQAVNSGGDIHSFYSKSVDGGKTFEKRVSISAPSGNDNFELSPRIVVSADGVPVVVWLSGHFDAQHPLQSLRSADVAYLKAKSVAVPEYGPALIVLFAAALATVMGLARAFRLFNLRLSR